MKKLLLIPFLILVLFTLPVNAQWSVNGAQEPKTNGYYIHFTGTLDSLGGGAYHSLTSNVFSLIDYDGCTDLEYSYIFSHAGVVKNKIVLFYSNETTTVASMDSVVLVDSNKVKVEVHTYKALQGIRAKYYAIRIRSLAGYQAGRDGATFSMWAILPKRDY